MKHKNKLKLSGLLLISILTITTASANTTQLFVFENQDNVLVDETDSIAYHNIFLAAEQSDQSTYTLTGDLDGMTIQSINQVGATNSNIDSINVTSSNTIEIVTNNVNDVTEANLMIKYDISGTTLNAGDLTANYTITEADSDLTTFPNDETRQVPYGPLFYDNTGDGSENNPYEISDWSDLSQAGSTNSNYILVNDISKETTTYDTEITQARYIPAEKLYGTFDGKNHIISDFEAPSELQANIFNDVDTGVIKNLGVENGSTNYPEQSLLTSKLNQGTLKSVFVEGKLSNAQSGGLAHEILANSQINNTYVNVEINATTGIDNVGGIARKLRDSNIENSYVVADFINNEASGLGTITSTQTATTFTDVYYDNTTSSEPQTSNTDNLTGVTALTTDEMTGLQAEENMDFDFANDWNVVSTSSGYNTDSYPVLTGLKPADVFQLAVDIVSPQGDVYDYLNRDVTFSQNHTISDSIDYNYKVIVEGDTIVNETLTGIKDSELVSRTEIINKTGFLDYTVELSANGVTATDSASFEINNPDIQGNYSQNHTVTNASRLNVDAEVPSGTAIEAIVTGYNSSDEVVFTDSQELYSGNNTVELNESLGKYNVRFEMLQESVNKPKVNTYSFQEENRVSTDTVSTALMTVAGGILIIAVVIIIVGRID